MVKVLMELHSKFKRDKRGFHLHLSELAFINQVPTFCVEFWELSHLTRDLSQAEEKIDVVTNCANARNDSCSACNNSYFLLSLK
jgi:hypothetical protein